MNTSNALELSAPRYDKSTEAISVTIKKKKN